MSIARFKIFIVLLFTAIPFVARAQSNIGFTAGVNRPVIIKSSSSPYEYSKIIFDQSFVSSVFYNENKGKHFELGLELVYETTNAYFEYWTGGKYDGHFEKGDINFGFLYLKAMPGFKFGNTFQFFINGGVFLGFLTNTNNFGKEVVNNFNVGIASAMGFRFNLSNKIGIEIRNSYDYSFAEKYRVGSLKDLNIMLTAGVFFKLGKHSENKP